MNGTDNLTTLPLVSVIIPTLNREKYLRQCIESVLSQDYPNFEVIVVDNGSTDNTPKILTSFGNKIRGLKEEKRGISAARNKGLQSAGGEFIAFLDDDDFFLPGKISLSTRKLLEDHFIALVSTDYVLVDSGGRRIQTVKKDYPQPEEFLWTFLTDFFCLLPSTALLRKKCLEKSGYFDETVKYAEDNEMWFRILKAGYRFSHIPEPLTAYRQHPENHCRKDNEKPIRLCWDKICSSAIEYFTYQELFGGILKNKDCKRRIKKRYDKFADTCYFNHLPRSARAAKKKSLEIGRPPSFFLLFMNNTLQIFPLLYNILENTVKISLVTINPKLTRWDAGKYRRKLNNLFFKLRYRLFKVFFYRYGK